jgi:aldose sugar dehydrogenase
MIVFITISIFLCVIIFTNSIHRVYSSDNTITSGNTGNNPSAVDFDSIVKHIEEIGNQKWVSNPAFVFVDNQSGKIVYGSASFWNDTNKNCHTTFRCAISTTIGWKDKATSFQVSTNTTNKNTWSFVYGNEIDVNPAEYQIVTHMKLNQFVRGSHIAIEGYNETSKKWYQIMQCPSSTNGSLEWHAFMCKLTIPKDTDKIRPILNAGWSSQAGKQAVTLFDAIYIINLADNCVEICQKFAPIITDSHLKVELVYQGLQSPSTMAFLGQNDILVMEEENGTVQRIVNGVEEKQPLLDVAVASQDGLLGSAIEKSQNGTTDVFLYYTESGGGEDGDDLNNGIKPKCNCLYRYELVNGKLVNPKLLLNLPTYPGPEHNGGIIKIGPDNNIYVETGSVDGQYSPATQDKALNFANGPDPDGRGGILRVTQNGQPVGIGILGTTFPLNLYYGYGIRNAFGMDFDPITKKLWNTENGPEYGDEINQVEPGFNSGFAKIQGFWQSSNNVGSSTNFIKGDPHTLVDFGGKGKYRDPELAWRDDVGVTALRFLNSDKLGRQYQNDMFVADANNGNIYHFKLNGNRTGLLLNGSLADKVVDNKQETQGIIFATGFGIITDMEVGPDGYLYIVSLDEGKIYRIVPDDKLSS